MAMPAAGLRQRCIWDARCHVDVTAGDLGEARLAKALGGVKHQIPQRRKNLSALLTILRGRGRQCRRMRQMPDQMPRRPVFQQVESHQSCGKALVSLWRLE